MSIEKPSSYLIWPIRITLFSSGKFSEYKNVQRFASLLVIINYIISFYASLSLVVNSSNVFMATESLSIFILLLLCCSETLVVILHKDMFLRALQRFENEIDLQFVKMTNKRFLDMIIIAFELVFIVEIPYQWSGLMTVLFFDVKLGTPESLLYPAHIPWRYDTKMKYIFTLMWEISTVIHPFVIGYGIIATYCALFVHLNEKFERLLDSIRNLDSIDNSKLLLNERMTVIWLDDDFAYSNSLHEVIKEHQNWKKTATELVSFTVDWAGLILGCVTFCSMFVMANILEPGIPVHLKIKSFSLFIFIFSHLFVVSFFGEYFQNANDKIRDTIYNTAWYTKSSKIQKTIATLLLQTQTSLTVKVYGMISVNMGLSLRMIRILYSMSNLYRNAFRHR